VIVRTTLTAGFTLIEMMIAMAMTLAVMAAIFTLVDSAQGTFQSQGEVPDMHQRLRGAIELLAADLRMAGGSDAPVRPYRVGGGRDDADAGVHYRPDTITVFHVLPGATPAAASAAATRTYYLKADAASDTFDLMQYDGRLSDLPVVDRVAGLAFEYFGDPRPPVRVNAGMRDNGAGGDPVRIDPAMLMDGPWWQEASGGHTFDADLLRLRTVGVTLRLRSALGPRFVPDLQVKFRVALRTMPGAE
jgi:prepilin-type N-terminal cleavage/methylation domain-containing protein